MRVDVGPGALADQDDPARLAGLHPGLISRRRWSRAVSCTREAAALSGPARRAPRRRVPLPAWPPRAEATPTTASRRPGSPRCAPIRSCAAPTTCAPGCSGSRRTRRSTPTARARPAGPSAGRRAVPERRRSSTVGRPSRSSGARCASSRPSSARPCSAARCSGCRTPSSPRCSRAPRTRHGATCIEGLKRLREELDRMNKDIETALRGRRTRPARPTRRS